MVIMVVVVVYLTIVSRAHSSMHLLTCPPSDEIYGMLNESI